MTNSNQYSPSFEHFKALAADYNLIPIYKTISAGNDTPVTTFAKVRRGSYGFLLESAEVDNHNSRYSFIGTEPSEIIQTGKGTAHGETEPMHALADRLKPIRHAKIDGLPGFDGGAVGYIAYDAIRYFEPRVPHISDEPSGLNVPEAIFMITESMCIFDNESNAISVVAHATINEDTNLEDSYQSAIKRIDELIDRIQQPQPTASTPDVSEPTTGGGRDLGDAIDYSHIGSATHMPQGANPEDDGRNYYPNMTKEDYVAMVNDCKQAIYDGEIIQVVVSQRLERRTPAKPFDLYCSLRRINPSPYMFYLDLDRFQIIGASPELMVQVLDRKVAVHPIAGSRPRGRTAEEDIALERELLSDEKEVAEHVMLLDLGRNDIGRIAQPGTVRVTKQMEIERYSHIMHIVSHVEGELAPEHDIYDALRAGFPAGTVSGAPKIRAMELIAEHEPNKRGPYSGAVGYWAYSGNMDTAISLRTMMLRDGVAYLQAGGGIVADSNPQTEYEETLHKMGALHHAIEHAEQQQ